MSAVRDFGFEDDSSRNKSTSVFLTSVVQQAKNIRASRGGFKFDSP